MTVNVVGTVSYGLSALAFLSLGLLIAAGGARDRGERRYRPKFILACAVSVLWSAVLTLNMNALMPALALPVAEALRDGAWLYFLVSLLPASGADDWTCWLRRVAQVLPALWLVFALWRWIAWRDATIGDADVVSSMVFGGLAMSLAGLALVEQIYRNLRPDRRWAIKYLCVGLGGVFAYDLYLYSYAMLLRGIDINLWDARGAVNALAVPLIAVAAARNPQWSAEVFVSRRVAFHTATLMGVGLYLLAMAGGGYYVREVGGTWGHFAEILFLAGAVCVLLVVLFSGQARARLRVFLNKHFFTYKYEYREEWLRLTRQLYSDRMYSDPYERAVVAVADIMDSPGGAVWLRRDGNVYAPLVNHNLRVADSATEAVDGSLAQFLHERQWIIDLSEYTEEPSRYGGLMLPKWLSALQQAWLVIPLPREGELLGFIVLARARAPVRLTWEDWDLLKAVGLQVGGFLAHNEDTKALSEARQFEAYNRVATFLMHDLKNIMAQQSLLVRNAARHKDNPSFIDDMIATVEHSVQRMGGLLEQLRRGGKRGDEVERVDVSAVVRAAVERLGQRQPKPVISSLDENARARAEPDALMMVVSHILRNAQDATSSEGNVGVCVTTIKGRVVIEVADDGYGMDAAFVRDRLFQPFYTTKASKGMGIGAYQAREFARAAGGDAEVESEPGHGTRFRIWLPQDSAHSDTAPTGVAL